MNIQDQIDILTAAKEGKRIEWLKEDGTWLLKNISSGDCAFDFIESTYRIAPEPPAKKWRAWNGKECTEMVGTVVKYTGDGDWRCMITAGGAALGGPVCFMGKESVSAAAMLAEYTMLDGSPCGVEINS